MHSLFTYSLILALLTFLGFLMLIGREILMPLVIAIVIWRVLVAMIEAVHAKRIGSFHFPYWLSTLAILLLALIITTRIAAIFYREFLDFTEQLPDHRHNLLALLESIPRGVLRTIPAFSSGDVEQGLTTILNTFFDQLSLYFSTLIAGLANFLSQAVIVVIYVVFLLLEQGTFSRKLVAMFPTKQQQDDITHMLNSIGQNINSYISIKTYISVLLGLATYVVMWLTGLEHAIVWAILSVFLNFLPYIGPVIAIILPFIIAILQSTNWGWILGVTGSLTLIQFIFGYVVEPKMMGTRLNVSPLVVLVSLSVFGALWGLAGMFLSVPLTVLLIIVLGHFQTTRPIAVLLSESGGIPEVDHVH